MLPLPNDEGKQSACCPPLGGGAVIHTFKKGVRGISPWAMRPELKICASAQRILQFLEKKFSRLWICTAVSTKEIIILFCLLQPRQCNVFGGNLKYLEDPLGTPCSSKASRENVDLDLHLSASDRGRFVLHIFSRSAFGKTPLLGPPKELQV